MNRSKILSTKNLEPLLIEKAKKEGIDIIEQEFIEIKPSLTGEKLQLVTELNKSGIEYIVLTSSNAVPALKILLEKSPSVNFRKVFCLSGITKEAVIEAGFPEKKIIAPANDAASLAKEIIRRRISQIIFCCGNLKRDELPELLWHANIKVHEVVVYETIETAKKITTDIDAVLFFSPSAVKSFFSLNQLKEDTVCFAIGQTTASSIQEFTNNKIITSEFPSQEKMISSVQNYFQNINCNE